MLQKQLSFAGVDQQEQFWLAAAELVAAQATLSCIQLNERQTLTTQLHLLETVLHHSTCSARLASWISNSTIVERAAGCVWVACKPFAEVPCGRAVLTALLQEFCSVMNESDTSGPAACHVNALLTMCLLAAGDSKAALQASAAAMHGKASANHQQIWAQRSHAVALLKDTDGSGMSKVGGYPSDFQATTWLCMAQCSELGTLGQEGLRQCLRAAEGKSDLSALCHIAVAEHIIQADTMMKIRPAVHSSLATALDLLPDKASPHAAGVVLRVMCLKAIISEDAEQELHWLRAASQSSSDALRVLLHGTSAREEQSQTQDWVVPNTFAAWLTVSPSLLVAQASRTENKQGIAFQRAFPQVTLDQVSRLLDIVVNMLRSKACMVECVPLLWLQYALLTSHFGDMAGSTLLLELSEILVCLSLKDHAAACFRHAGAPCPFLGILSHNIL
jgi:hypothetical protein